MEQIDERIARILAKCAQLPDDLWPNGPVVWQPPLSEEAVAAYEREKGIRLPEDYRLFLTTAANGGNQPFYGLTPLDKQPAGGCIPEQPFPFTPERFPFFLYMTQTELDAFDEKAACAGFLHLCTEGDGMDSILIVNSADPAVCGTVWFYDLANEFGILPLLDRETGQPLHFLDWLEYWADLFTTTDYDFTFASTAHFPQPPDDPNILGRIMGLITD